MTKQQTGKILFYILIVFPIVLFILMPAHAAEGWAVWVDGFLNHYLFGNGYYQPDNYPFAAKVANSLSVVFALVVGTVYTVIFRYDLNKVEGDGIKLIIGMLLLMLFSLWLSVFPQEFVTESGRNFWRTRSFHNNPVCFLFLIFAKEFMLYIGVYYFGQKFFELRRKLKNH